MWNYLCPAFIIWTIVYTIGLILLSGYSQIFLISSIVGALSSAYLFTLGRPLVIFFQGTMTSVISQNVFTTFTQLRNVPAVISFLSTLSFCDSVYFRMELKAQMGSCFPFSTKKLHLSSKVDPFIETASKNRFSLLKYVSLV